MREHDGYLDGEIKTVSARQTATFEVPSYRFAIYCWPKPVVKLITRKLLNALFLPFFPPPKSLKSWSAQTLNPHIAILVP